MLGSIGVEEFQNWANGPQIEEEIVQELYTENC